MNISISRVALTLLLSHSIIYLFAEGSKNLTPALGGGDGTVANTFVGYLEHDAELAAFGFSSGTFLQEDAGADERMYIRMRPGETLYFGLRRIVAAYVDQTEADHEDLNILIYANNGTIVGRYHINSATGLAPLDPANQGVIDDYASVLAGPQQVAGVTGYDALEYTNTTGLEQDFYVAFFQTDADLTDDVTYPNPTEAANDVDVRSWYDLWDFSVFDGLEEKPGRLFCKKWNFTAGSSTNQLSINFQLYPRIPSIIDGQEVGSFVKEIDLSGMEPYSINIYANSQGSTTGADFTVQRQSQNAETALLEYDIYINNPDIDVYPTTPLPTINITDAYFDCSSSRGSAIINFNANQVGSVAIILDLNGVNGYQDGTTDVIIEREVTAIGSFAIMWDGLDGQLASVASGTQINISGRFTAAPLHVPLWDVEENTSGIRMIDVRPATSFDLIYWDDSGLAPANGSAPNDVELTGSDVNTHTWGGNPGQQLGNNILTNTWSFGYFQINTQTINFVYDCDVDGDGVPNNVDADGDNDGLSDVQEGDYKGDADTDNIPDYLDADFFGFLDTNSDAVNDNFDTDLDGVPDALDIDSDNDGIPDLIEVGLVDVDNDGRLDTFSDGDGNGWDNTYDDGQGGFSIDLLVFSNDPDGDGISNYIDLDSDDDGLVDSYEAGGTAGSDGQINGFTDADLNGRNDEQDVAALGIPNTDADGTLANYVDIDSDNDGIPDNNEAQASISFIASVVGDVNSNGLLDIYDPNIEGGILIVPVDTDADNVPDYLDLDSDDDGVVDQVEGFDADRDGFGDWDTEPNGVLDANDLVNFNLDSDAAGPDGLWNIFDSDFAGSSAASLPNNDSAGLSDWQDTDDDNDGILTSGEDFGGDDSWTNDFTQGGSPVPDYLYRGDFDGDGVEDTNDIDDDNDGILDVDETTADTDGDGITNNLDLDSDADGILDAIEANDGAIPSNWNTTTGQFNLNDPDGDGLMNAIDNTPGAIALSASTLANSDSDGDGVLNDHLDIDSDGDGITDFHESIAATSTLAPSGNDMDGDGIDDAFDPDQGGTLIIPVNSDGEDNPDYRDNDSDNDGVEDLREGHDVNNDGFGDWDSEPDGVTNELTSDLDNDGLDDDFDTSAVGFGNAAGSNAARQNTDGTDQPDFRDSDDDNDGTPTSGEDGGDGDWTNDFNDGGNPIPDYLFLGDFDGDGEPDATDPDSDNDGIPDLEEDLEGTEIAPEVDPSADEDADGIPNFRDEDVPTGLDDATDSNGDAVYDIFDSDLDGIPNFRDSDSDNDGISDIVEAGGINTNGDGHVDNELDTDNDGLVDAFDSDQGGSLLANPDTDGDGIRNSIDRDSDNDGLPDSIESGGTDTDGDGQIDDFIDTDSDGFADVSDTDNGGVNPNLVDTDGDLILDIHDKDSDNDGVTDVVEYGGIDTDGDGNVDGYATDTDTDGLADAVDPDHAGSPLNLEDFDGDGIPNARDLDSDNDGYQDIWEAGGLDTDNDGIVNSMLDSDGDGIPNSADVSQLGGSDIDGDEIDDSADASYVANSDDDGDGIINAYDPDADGDGYDDNTRIDPWYVPDFDQDGQRDYLDLDSDGDGIVDVLEFGGLTVNTSTGQIDGFSDGSTVNGWNSTQEPVPGGAMPISPLDTDGRMLPQALANYIDLDADDDGIADLIEAQNSGSYLAPSGIDINNNGLDDAFDPNLLGTLIIPVNTDSPTDGLADYLDDDSDNDNVPDVVEGSNAGKGQFADWETGGLTNDLTDEIGYDEDTDDDGFLDVFDNVDGPNALGSNAAVQDSDRNGTDDFQDIDDDGDGTNSDLEDFDTNGDPTNDFNEGGNPIPDYLFVVRDADGDGVLDNIDLDADNDGLANTNEDGGTGVNPGLDIDADGLLNYEDADMDGDGIPNVADSDADGIAGDDIWDKSDSNGDGVIDAFDTDFDGVPDMLDRDSDNDGIADIVELGLSDLDEDGRIDAWSDGATVNGIDTNYDPNGVTAIDTDSDGVSNHLDLDSDNDGITDNREAQATVGYVGPTFIDSDSDGIMDVYDGFGNALNPIDTDLDTVFDYLDSDSDEDGVQDFVEAFDANADGFSDLDTDQDRSISDEFGFNIDSDNDGLYVIFDTSNTGFISILNIDGSNQVLQDTDQDGEVDFRDTNDDGDLLLTSLEETTDGGAGGSDGNWTNDFTQGGIAIPDYLYFADEDNDLIQNVADADADNDGIPNANEYAIAVNPFGDGDGDGRYNYLDPTDATLPLSLTDANLDGIADEYDQDLDGIPNFFDLDSDNDGIMDGYEINAGNFPPGFSNTSGRFISGVDVDGDGIVAAVDQNDNDLGNTTSILYNAIIDDADSDGLPDFLDLDSDNDGIADNFESQFPATYSLPSGLDSDNDGLDDEYDPSSGSFIISPINTDLTDVDDYLDTDSDNDGVPDNIEGHDMSKDGFADWDTDDDNSPVGETGYNLDTDGDGVWDLFDSYSGSGINNVTGLVAGLQDSDEDGIPDFRDPDDDSDGTLTSTEDGGDMDWTNDFTQGGGLIPDYLFSGGDNDLDGVVDASDLDSDNDGVPDDVENTTSGPVVDPFADADANGMFNYLDAGSLTELNDNNNDGVADEFDFDLDGVPNFFDLDSDNDGITDHLEGGGTDDADGDGVIDNFNDSGPEDGLDDDGALPAIDSDGDGQADFLDIDSDNDGIQDIIEAGSTDTNGDGFGDTAGDLDDDGQLNSFDPDAGSTLLSIPDSDGDGLRNYRDADSDNDGIADIVEGGWTDDGDGQVDNPSDMDGDGWDDDFDSTNGGEALTPPDTDGDGLRNFMDVDSDNDGIPDVAEANSENAGTFPAAIVDFDGRYPYTDGDNDGLVDNVDIDNSGNPIIPPNTGGSALPDYLDTDSDGDGFLDAIEGFDDDEDDTANDALDDLTSRADVFSGSPYVNSNDNDADGIPNWLEGSYPNFLNPNNSTYWADSDGDGLVDLYDMNDGGAQYTAPDNDGDLSPNQLDAGTEVSLPVELIFFNGRFEKGKVVLTWQTVSEINNAVFSIERSTNGNDFREIGRKVGSGNSSHIINYDFVDVNPANGTNYYRLGQYDFDGSLEFSEIIMVEAYIQDFPFDVYPNPVRDHLSVFFHQDVGKVTLRFVDMTGALLIDSDLELKVSQRELAIDTSKMKSGLYLLSLTANGKTVKRKIMLVK